MEMLTQPEVAKQTESAAADDFAPILFNRNDPKEGKSKKRFQTFGKIAITAVLALAGVVSGVAISKSAP